MIEWRFKPNSRDDMDVDPIQGEFFTTRDIGNISNAVIREGIQNALDERDREALGTVKVRIFLSGEKCALQPVQYSPLLQTLLPHLKAKKSGLAALPDLTGKMKFLVFEDFYTKGLEGDPEEFYVEGGDGNSHNFYYFWRNVGRSGKTDDKLGRWGLGKTVFPASSKINTFWGLTVRKSDQRKLLMGQSILRIHNRDDHKREESGYKPYGIYGKYHSNDCFAVPVEDEKQLIKFERLFNLQRGSMSGLSLVIPFCSDEITLDHLAYSVIEQYFYPILQGKLVVEISEEDKTVFLERASIESTINEINFKLLNGAEEFKVREKENIVKLFDFAKWTLGIQDEDFYSLSPLDLSKKPRWQKATLFADEKSLDLLRDKFERGERVAFKVPLKYHPVNGQPKTCFYDAFLEKDTLLTRPENLFVRDGITITGISSLDKGLVRGMVIIHDVDLARMLGDSENPAHTEWQADSRNFKGKYVDGKDALSFVKATLKQLYENLQRPIQGIQKDLLVDFFSIPKTTEAETTHRDLQKKDHGPNETEEEQIPILSGKKKPFIVEQIHTGLKLFKNPDAQDVPESIRIKLGYDVPRGNPIASYQELDFDVARSPVKIESKGVYFTKKEKNVLEFDIESDTDFQIVLTGFDEKRDLFVKLQ